MEVLEISGSWPLMVVELLLKATWWETSRLVGYFANRLLDEMGQ